MDQVDVLSLEAWEVITCCSWTATYLFIISPDQMSAFLTGRDKKCGILIFSSPQRKVVTGIIGGGKLLLVFRRQFDRIYQPIIQPPSNDIFSEKKNSWRLFFCICLLTYKQIETQMKIS